MQPETATILAAVIGVIGAVFGAIYGTSRGARGKKKAIEKLTPEMDLHGSTWKGEYVAPDGEGGKAQYPVTVEFEQFGGHVAGEGRENGRKWLIEGVAYQRRLCYVYVDTDPNRLSIGSSTLELDATGKILEGVWVGWSPDGERLNPNRLVLNKVPSG